MIAFGLIYRLGLSCDNQTDILNFSDWDLSNAKVNFSSFFEPFLSWWSTVPLYIMRVEQLLIRSLENSEV